MTCRARGAARAGTGRAPARGRGQARGRDKLDWLVPSCPLSSPLVLHNSSSCEIEPKAPSHLHARLPSPRPICHCRCVCSRLIAVACVLEQCRRIASFCLPDVISRQQGPSLEWSTWTTLYLRAVLCRYRNRKRQQENNEKTRPGSGPRTTASSIKSIRVSTLRHMSYVQPVGTLGRQLCAA